MSDEKSVKLHLEAYRALVELRQELAQREFKRTHKIVNLSLNDAIDAALSLLGLGPEPHDATQGARVSDVKTIVLRKGRRVLNVNPSADPRPDVEADADDDEPRDRDEP